MANASKIVSDCQQALGKGDFTAARKLVHDNLLFQGPIDTFHSPEPYFEALKKLHPIIQRIDMKKTFADATMYASCTTWLPRHLPGPHLFANGIGSRARRLPRFAPSLMRGHSPPCSRERLRRKERFKLKPRTLGPSWPS